jgi:hypothetical protein
MYKLSKERIAHLNTHFVNSEDVGSVFYKDVFASPFELLYYINSNSPNEIIIQLNGRETHIFNCEQMGGIGNTGIANRKEVDFNFIIKENRNGFMVDVALVSVLQVTNTFCVVIEKDGTDLDIITAFPGPYAPPFPYKAQNEVDYKLSEIFWNRHVLLRFTHPDFER